MNPAGRQHPVKLVIDRLAAERGGRTVFADLSFAVAGGEAMIVVGPNGAGKTTLLRTLAGFLRPAAGTVALEGGAEDTDTGEQCHYVGHQNGSKPALTVGENLRFWARYLGSSEAGSIAPALDRLGLGDLEAIPAGYLSAGQKRRLALARLLVAPRPLWLLDEPSVSLDVASVERLAALVREHVEGGGIVVAATHVPLGVGDARELQMGTPAASP